MLKEELERILNKESNWKYIGEAAGIHQANLKEEKVIKEIRQLFKQYIADKEPEKKDLPDKYKYFTSFNEEIAEYNSDIGYNKAIQEYRQALEEGL